MFVVIVVAVAVLSHRLRRYHCCPYCCCCKSEVRTLRTAVAKFFLFLEFLVSLVGHGAWQSVFVDIVIVVVLSSSCFPTCQVKVARFNLSCPARLLLVVPVLLLGHLNCKLVIAVVRPPDLNCKR